MTSASGPSQQHAVSFREAREVCFQGARSLGHTKASQLSGGQRGRRGKLRRFLFQVSNVVLRAKVPQDLALGSLCHDAKGVL